MQMKLAQEVTLYLSSSLANHHETSYVTFWLRPEACNTCSLCVILSVLICSQAMWKPAYDFLVTWAAQIGDSYRDVIQELHMGLDKMKNPITKRWKHLTGTLILVNCLDALRSSAFSPASQDDYAI